MNRLTCNLYACQQPNLNHNIQLQSMNQISKSGGTAPIKIDNREALHSLQCQASTSSLQRSTAQICPNIVNIDMESVEVKTKTNTKETSEVESITKDSCLA